MKRVTMVLALFVMASAHAEKVALSFNQAPLPDVLRVVYADVLGASFVLDDEVLKSTARVSLELRGLEENEIANAVGAVAEGHGFMVERRGATFYIGKRREADEKTLIYVPVNRSSAWLSEVVSSAVNKGRFSQRQAAMPAPNLQNSAVINAANQSPALVPQGPVVMAPGASQIETERQILVFTGPPKEAYNVLALLKQIDTPIGEIVLKAVVFEVGLRGTESSALALAASLLKGHVVATAGVVIDGAKLAIRAGGIDAVVSGLSQDDRFKVVSRPQVRVRSGGSARFSVGTETPVTGAAVVDRNGNPIQSIEYRPSGIVLTAKPWVREGGVELAITQEISSFQQTTTGVNTTPTLSKRMVDTSLTLQPGEVVVLAGLEQSQEASHSDSLPFLGWLVGKGQASQKTEMMVFVEAQRL